MTRRVGLGQQLRSLIWKTSVDEEVAAELQFHLEMRTRRNIERGMEAEAARSAALRRFGDVQRVERDCRVIGRERDREMQRAEWLADLKHDLIFAVRQLRRARGFTTVALLTLMLGIGGTTTIFSIVDGVLLRPLPYADPSRLMKVYEGGQEGFSALDFLDLQRQAHSFAGTAAYGGATTNLTGDGEPERLRGRSVTANFFTLLGVRALRGRTFAPGEDQPGAPRVAVLNDDLWTRRFGADPSVVGRTITLNGEAVTVIGVLDPATRPAGGAEIFVPLIFGPTQLSPPQRGSHSLGVVGRLAPGATVESAQVELGALAKRLSDQYQDTNAGMKLRLVSMHEDLTGDVRLPLLVLLGAVALVLLIACTNVANLMLVRAAGRETEIAVRTALGAGRARLVRQLVSESVLLSAVGGALGMLLASWMVRWVRTSAPGNIPLLTGVTVDLRVMMVTALVAVATGVLFGLVPALYATTPDLSRSLRDGVRGSQGGNSGRARSALVVAELALSLMLLAGAGLLIRSFHQLAIVDPGFRPERVMTFSMSLPASKYKEKKDTRPFTRELVDRLARLPGVQSAAVVFGLPMGETSRISSLAIEGQARTAGTSPEAGMAGVTDGFFATLGISALSGRLFTPDDKETSARVAVVNRAFARRYFGSQNPVGRFVRVDGLDDDSGSVARQIVGLVGDIHTVGLADTPTGQMYLPLAQYPERYLVAVIRTSGEPRTIVRSARAQVHAIDPELPTFAERTMAERVGQTIAQPRFYMLLLVSFAAVALLLATVGIYGVMSYAVTQRARELGIRVALGARPADVLKLIVRQGAALTTAGVVIGLLAALALSRLIGSLLFGVTATDVTTYVAVSGALTVVALAACMIPARRAAGVDPLVALRGE
ncbi:MAG: ABC transporter permease [Gemmatimonadota bacterium]|nr:ABC transporter permease [Gemmatimonadota bacterium]